MALDPNSRLIKPAYEFAKSIAFKYTRLLAPHYPYNIEPIQLATIIMELDRLKQASGCVAEIGVARGMTTRFICEHLVAAKADTRLYAIDTFTSFTEADLDYEVKKRGKDLFELKGFAYNDFDIWQRNFSDFPFVKAIQADCSTFDYASIGPIKVAFLDVDLYLPTRNALPGIYKSLIPGGAIIVDDVMDNSRYDGAYQAYMEFCQELGVAPIVVGSKCGVIRKPA
jgi:predicted O-methyltransferase YrrM